MAKPKELSRGNWFRRSGEAARDWRFDLDALLLPHERSALASWHWEVWGRDEQLAPPGEWRVWLICAGRGFGKTRAGAEWVRNLARHDAQARIALVGASLGEVRSVMVEGESGILNAARGALVPEYEPSLRRLQWPNGAQAFLYSAAEPESLRWALPFLFAGQAQKEVFVNEALARLDTLLHPLVEGTQPDPPPVPAEGEAWIVAPAATGDWAGHDDALACYQSGQWLFAPPVEEMIACDRTSGERRLFSNGWNAAPAKVAVSGGATIDSEARTAIAAIVAALSHYGLMSQS